jgi:cob(I)alamin adenosyltransferase
MPGSHCHMTDAARTVARKAERDGSIARLEGIKST